MYRYSVIGLLWVMLATLPVAGQLFHKRDKANPRSGGTERFTPQTAPDPYTGTAKECKDAIDEVNAARAKRGLKPYQNDPLLAQAAYKAASIRASRLIAGHLPNDFDCVPAGGHATTAGCAAWRPDWGFGACALYDNYTCCGAAWVLGKDGKRYMHCFYR